MRNSRNDDTAMLTFGARVRRVPPDEVMALVRQARKEAKADPYYTLAGMCDDLGSTEADLVIGASLAEAVRQGMLASRAGALAPALAPDPASVWVMGTYTPARKGRLPARLYYRESVVRRLMDPQTPAAQTHDVYVLCSLITRIAMRLDTEGRVPGLPCRLAGCANGRVLALPHSRDVGLDTEGASVGPDPGPGPAAIGIATAAVVFFGDLAPRAQAMVERILERGAHMAYLRAVAASSPDSRYHVSLPPARGGRQRPALVS